MIAWLGSLVGRAVIFVAKAKARFRRGRLGGIFMLGDQWIGRSNVAWDARAWFGDGRDGERLAR